MKEIILLDGTTHTQEELIDQMYIDSFYYDYLKQAAMSSSMLSKLKRSVKEYVYSLRYSEPRSQALIDGGLFHTMILEPEKLNHYVFLDVESKNTKAYKEAAEHHSEVFTKKEKRESERLVDAIFRCEQAKSLLINADYEVPMIDYIQGMPFRGKADVLRKDGTIIDLKTSLDIHTFHISSRKWGYHRQAYIYCTLFGVPYDKFKFLVIDKKSLDIGIFDCSEEFFEYGKQDTHEIIDKYHQTVGNPNFELDDYILRATL
jgi:hypothetical protein